MTNINMTDHQFFVAIMNMLGLDEYSASNIIKNPDGAPVSQRTIQKWYSGKSTIPDGVNQQLAKYYAQIHQQTMELNCENP